MRQQTKKVAFLILLLLAVVGCESSDPVAVAPQAQAYKRVQISLDSVTSGTASTRRNFYFILDGSGSMGWNCEREQKIVGAKRAVRQFLQTIPSDVNIGLYVFDAAGESERLPIGKDNRAAFLSAVDAMNYGGGTPLARAIRFGTDRLVDQYKRQLGYGTYAIIVVTDGEASSLGSAARYARQYGFSVHTIGFCIGGDHPLRTLADSYRAANNAEEIARGLTEIVAEPATFDAPTEFVAPTP